MKGKKSKLTEKDLRQALIKKAMGYDATETIEEYSAGEEGEIKLTKKKVTKKSVPPDLSALKMLIDSQTVSLEKMTDDELIAEKNRLLAELKKLNKE